MDHQQEVSQSGDSHGPKATKRLMSLDAFRGLTILGMLLVNNIALDTDTPRNLTHAPWNQGIYFADLIFPWFLFIVGVAITYAAASHIRKGLPLWRYDLKAFSRAASLILLGCLIDSSLAKRPVFDLGVLQIIGLAYLIAALLVELPVSRRMIIAVGLLAMHWAAIRFLPIPGVGSGVFTQNQNLINHLNQTYLMPFHLNGLISVIPTSALALIGTVIGDILRRDELGQRHKTIYLLAGGLVLALIGWLWNLDLPFNKPVWTSSYILFTSGLGSILLGVLYLLIDVRMWRMWAFPLVIFGMNAIAAYVIPILVKVYVLQGWTWKMPDGSTQPLQAAILHACKAHFGGIGGGWTYTASYILVWWLVLLYMYRKKVFLRI